MIEIYSQRVFTRKMTFLKRTRFLRDLNLKRFSDPHVCAYVLSERFIFHEEGERACKLIEKQILLSGF